MRICCSLPVALSLADTLTMPFASMSKVTSICGIPRGDGGMPIRSNWPSILLSAAISRSPWKTRMVTAFWLSSAVENTWLFLVGIVVLRSMMRVNTPPSVSMPSDSGVTSSSSTSLTSPCKTPAWIAAPMATTSSGLTPLCGSLPNSCFTASWTFGLRGRGQFDLGLFGGLFQALQGQLVVAQVDALLFLEFVGQIADEAHVEIFAAQE